MRRSLACSSRSPLATLTFSSDRSFSGRPSKPKRRCSPSSEAAWVLKYLYADHGPTPVPSLPRARHREVDPAASWLAGTAHAESAPLATVAPAPEATTTPVAGLATSKSTCPELAGRLVNTPCSVGVVVPVSAESPGVIDRLSTGSGTTRTRKPLVVGVSTIRLAAMLLPIAGATPTATIPLGTFGSAWPKLTVANPLASVVTVGVALAAVQPVPGSMRAAQAA